MQIIKEFLRRHKELITLLLCLGAYCSLTMALHIPCPILWLTGVSCPGCGITRAMLSICRLDFAGAVYYNPSAFGVIVAAILLLICYIRKDQKMKRIVLMITAVVMIVVYLFRFTVLHASVLQFAPESGIFPRLWRWVSSVL